MEAILSENVLMTGVRWFNLPNTETIISDFEAKFNINKKKKSIVFRKEDVEKFFVDNVEINIY